MKFGANTWIWFSPFTVDDIRSTAIKMAEAGFDLIEFPIETVDAFNYQEMAAIVRDYGLGVSTCAAMGPDRDLIHPEESIRENGMAYIRHCIEAARTMGASNLVGPIYSAVGRTWQATGEERARDTDLLVSQLSSLAASQAIAVIDRVDHPFCKIMLDTFHMNVEESSLGEAIRTVGAERLGAFHACENDRGVPGVGHVPWSDVAQGLRDINYDGPVVIESFTAKVKSIARAAAIWRALAPTQDAIAYDGLKFLKQLLA
jgi:D-psicose/D-tagatose/L-ribulose 3-epimerase